MFIRQVVTQEVVVQSVQLLVPNPGLPFQTSLDWQATSQLSGDDTATPPCNGDTILFAHSQNRCGDTPRPHPWTEWLGSLVLLVAADILLRFRLVTALQPAGAWRRGSGSGRFRRLVPWVIPPVESTRMALHHGFVVVRHVWLLRITVAGVGGLFLVLPSALAQSRLIPGPWDNAAGMAWVPVFTTVLADAATVLIGALVVTFCAVYDARLYVRLAAARVHRSGGMVKFPPPTKQEEKEVTRREKVHVTDGIHRPQDGVTITQVEEQAIPMDQAAGNVPQVKQEFRGQVDDEHVVACPNPSLQKQVADEEQGQNGPHEE
jgi:hypothetical protein